MRRELRTAIGKRESEWESCSLEEHPAVTLEVFSPVPATRRAILRFGEDGGAELSSRARSAS